MRSLIIASLLLSLYASAATTPSESNNQVSLREYMDIRFEAMDNKFETANKTAQEAITVANAVRADKDKSQNEWRDSLDDNNKIQMPRLEAEQADKQMIARLDSQDRRITDLESRRGAVGQVWMLVVGAIGAIGGIIAIVVNMKRWTNRPSILN